MIASETIAIFDNNSDGFDRRLVYKNMYKLGIYYGYPKCCINAFIVSHSRNDSFVVECEGGFVPCDKHLDMITFGYCNTSDLIQNRKCEVMFPHG